MPTQAQLRRWQREEADRRNRWLAEERARVLCQRAIWKALPASEAKDRLREAMLAQAWTLLDAGKGEACDALLEFLPEEDQDRLLREFFPDDYA